MIKTNELSFKTYKFGDIALNISERAEPKETKLDIYVGLEHLDPDCIHIRRKGHPADVKGTKLRVYPGDIIFGKRRAYQRKAAIVDFNGICSAHAMVVRANPRVIIPDLLPFFMHSDAFMHRAVDVSEGSLSPTIKWKILADQEFKIPSLNDQKRIASLLWSIDDVVEKKLSLKISVNNVYLSYLEQIYTSKGRGVQRKIKDMCDVNAKTLSANTDPNYRFKYLDIASILGPNMLGNLKEYFFKDAPSRARRVVNQKSLVLSLVRPYFQSFVIIDNDTKDCIASTGTAVLDVRDGFDHKFVFHSFFTKRFSSFCEQRMNGTSYPAITPNDLKHFEILVPSFKEQCEYGRKLSALKEIEAKCSREIGLLNEMEKQITNQIFG